MPILDGKLCDHHRHALSFMEFESRYICDGCGEPGYRSGYRCPRANCNFVLHEQCLKSFGNHFNFNRFPGCDFVFVKRLKVVNEVTKRASTRCDVCAKTINGYAYTAKTRNGGSINIHPPCACLPSSLKGGRMELVQEIKSKCVWCRNGHLPGHPNSWAYISTTSKLQIHVGCLKDLSEWLSGGSIFGGTLIKGNSYLPLQSASNSTRPSSSNSTAIVPYKQPSTNKSTTIVPSKQPSTSYSTAIVPSEQPSRSYLTAIVPYKQPIVPSEQPSRSYSTAIVPYKQPIVPRKRDQIKKYAKDIGHAVAAVLGPLKAIAPLGVLIANLIGFLY